MMDQLVEKIREYNMAYRIGSPIVPDSEYDQLIEELELIDASHPVLTEVGHFIIDESRKEKLPIAMASMNKIKSVTFIDAWCTSKNIKKSEEVIITPKFDGLSLCVKEIVGWKESNDAFTRGDGEYGQKSNDHYKLIGNKLLANRKSSSKIFDDNDRLTPCIFEYTYGEAMIPKEVFMDKYSEEYANPRNLVAGLLNSKTPDDMLMDTQYIKYGAVMTEGFKHYFETKKEVLDQLNINQKMGVKHLVCKISEITEQMLIDLFYAWSDDFEIDGLIIEINDLNRQDELGRETSSNNPAWARAYKHPSFEESAESTVIGITWNISKQGYLKPILHIDPVKLDGVTVSNVTGNNARFVKELGLGVGAKVVIRRSGFVIPKIVDVLEAVDFVLPIIHGVEIIWNKAGIELITVGETDDQKLKKIIAFFEILESDSVRGGVITQLWDAGYKTIGDILRLNISDLELIDRFGKRKAKIVFDSIQKSVKNVKLSKLQHATGIFPGMGSKRLVLLEHFTEKPTVDQVMEIEGFADISAKTYVDNYDKFFYFIKDLPVNIENKIEVVRTSNDLEGMVFVFTGVRMKSEEIILESRGAKVSSSVSKNTTHLVCKDTHSGSSKLERARSTGVKVIGIDDFLKIIN